MEIYQLTKKQQAAFNALKKAADKCNNLNIGFVNLYGSITAYDKSIISAFGVDANLDVPCRDYGYPFNSLNNLGGDSYADDQMLHSFKLTDKGLKIFNEEKNN